MQNSTRTRRDCRRDSSIFELNYDECAFGFRPNCVRACVHVVGRGYFSTIARERPFCNNRAGFKSIARELSVRVVTLTGTKNDERRSFRLEYRDCYPRERERGRERGRGKQRIRASSDDLLLTPTPTLFFVKRMAHGSERADLRNAKLCGLYSHGRVITFP